MNYFYKKWSKIEWMNPLKNIPLARGKGVGFSDYWIIDFSGIDKSNILMLGVVYE